MYILLLILGITSIVLGLYNIRNESYKSKNIYDENKVEQSSNFKEVLEENFKYNILEKRVDEIEKILLNDNILTHDDFNKIRLMVDNEDYSLEKLSLDEDPIDNKSEEKEAIKTYLKIKKLEEDNKSIDEICRILNINKGEVILLKNLYKNY